MMLASHHQPQPTFSGRTVTQWLTGKDFSTNQAAVTTAVLALGEGSVPALRRMLHSGTKLSRLWFAWAPRWLYRRLPIGGYQFEHKDRAMWALQTLGRAGHQATPDLLTILQDTTEHWNQRSGAMATLRYIEAEPSVVIPILEKLKTDPVVGSFAASEARSLRRVAESQRYAESQRSFAASRSTGREVQKAEFQPSSSFLDKSSLWRPDKPMPTSTTPGSNEWNPVTNRP
jgi:HEAT repeat protein